MLRLNDIMEASSAKRILIKLDIEGMEIEALESYVPGEHRAVVIFGELHGHKENRVILERLFAEHQWSFQLGDLSGDDAIFEAHSPAAEVQYSPSSTEAPGVVRAGTAQP